MMINAGRVAIACLLAALAGPASAQELQAGALGVAPAWASGYQMGTVWAGVSDDDGGRLTFYCGGPAADDAPLVRPGPYVLFAIGGVPDGIVPGARLAVEVVVDGAPLDAAVPMTVIQAKGMTELEWSPQTRGAAELTPVVEALRAGGEVRLKVAGTGIDHTLPLAGSAAALDIVTGECVF